MTEGRPGGGVKWLDLRRLCSRYLSAVGEHVGEKTELERVYYFSATPTHRSDDKVERHRLYMRALRGTGVNVELGPFKRKERRCKLCGGTYIGYEEKETDVAIAARLVEVFVGDEADAVILVTGDTDLAPAVRTCRRLFPDRLVCFAFPYGRAHGALRSLAPESFTIKPKACIGSQFPDPLVLPDGTKLAKPDSW
jgi:hypothetical protein